MDKKRLQFSMQTNAAVALIGARQVGKTTICKNLSLLDKSTVYLDLENPKDILKLKDPFGYLASQSNKLVIIDEIQRIPDLFTILRGLIDDNRQKGIRAAQFLLLGSASMNLLRQSSESLAGRISYLTMGTI